jgi:hypothetical protein
MQLFTNHDVTASKHRLTPTSYASLLTRECNIVHKDII